MEWNHKRSQVINEQIFAITENISFVRFDQKEIDDAIATKNVKQNLEWKDLSSEFGLSGVKSKRADESVNLKEDYNLPSDMKSMMECSNPLGTCQTLSKSTPIPITLINTRDCFAYDLKWQETELNLGPKRQKIIKKVYYFDPAFENGYPENFKDIVGLGSDADMKNVNNLRVGVTTYENFFTQAEMDDLEKNIEITEKKSLNDAFLPMTS